MTISRKTATAILLFIILLAGGLGAQGGESEKEEERREMQRILKFARIDRVSKTLWPIKTQGEANWNEATGFCKKSRLGAFWNWRLPTEEEARIVFRRKKKLKLDFGEGLYWLSGDAQNHSKKAAAFDFSKGSVNRVAKSESHLFRCVSGKDRSGLISGSTW